jgi:UDP-N-acetylglucosamine--N-acetylmuramyl-(pentapeptide) pyrophosphoryl-undecaprenol N-acetylglucosamine transferase
MMHNMKTAASLVTARIKAEKLLRRFAPGAVIGTGGYICYPILKKAAQMGIPTIIHESNAVPGLTTKLLSSSVDRVLISFPGLEASYRRPERVFFTGTPVRWGFRPVQEGGAAPFSSGKPLVLSFWGSLGAEHMNETLTEFIGLNIAAGAFDHVHAAGKSGSVEAMRRRLKQLGAPDELPGGIEIREYIEDMHSVMAAADIIICRAGGSTIAELTMMGKPAVLIPSPYVTNDQQVENAKQVQKAGGALMLLEKDCTGEVLFAAVDALLQDGESLRRMSDAQLALGAPDAAGRIAEMVMGLCGHTIKDRRER